MRVDSIMSEQRLSDHLWSLAAPVWERIERHPFLLELEAGTLPIESFQYYILQDYLYLGAFGRAAAAALSVAADTPLAKRLLRRVSTPVERPLHASLFDALGVTEHDVANTLPSPTNLAYMNHIEVSMRVDGLACGIAALLPCPRIYHEVGKILHTPEHPVYRIWQSTYAEGLLEASSAAWSELVDDMADAAHPDTIRRMTRAYLTSARYEHMFWTMAYNQERWPV